MDEDEEVEASLDQLSQAFAAAMGRQKAQTPIDDAPDAAPPEPTVPTISNDVAVADPCPVTPKSILEAILFVGHPENEPIDPQRVASLLRGVKVEEVENLVTELNSDYESLAMPFEIKPIGKGYHLQLRAEHQPVRERFYGNVREAKLSQLAVDILAVVAYNQPIDTAALQKLVSDSRPIHSTLNQLIRRDLIGRRKSETPRQWEYFTTDRFLDLFALRDLGDLPRTEDPQ